MEKEETLDEMERSIREYGDMLDNTMESSDNIVIPIERELFGEEIELGHFSIEKSDLLDICSMDWLSVSCMTTYMKYLYGSFMSSQERYTFANPSNFTNYGNDDGEKVQHLQHILGYVRRNQILLIPYNLGAIRAFTYAGGKRMMAGPNWQVVKCPKQPGGVECAYYVMMFMRHFLRDPSQSLTNKVLDHHFQLEDSGDS
ncbi:hypothetical protein IFM89_013570 [Coptis chinensis]|uniref:Ubiquitin-like protease family profile domain-containing protein n=1 Tax=Coptis chinensis TaxID=261450 RepID=A0A835HZX8_9MAGN|nr:hypothetical protein IFM89_013570 [Coptis chinensis]